MSRAGSSRRRDTHDLIVEILTLTIKGQKKTRIMADVGLSYSQLKRYLDRLKESGFIAEESGVWKTTKKGAHVIEACQLCQRIAHETL